MKMRGNHRHLFKSLFILLLCSILYTTTNGQKTDTLAHKQQKGVFKNVIKAISRDTNQIDKISFLKRIDDKYLRYSGLVIRNISYDRLSFGTSLKNRTTQKKSTIIKLANRLHHLTREEVVQKNLFFHPGDSLNPFLLADNERFLRELPYIKDVDFDVYQIPETDSVDITVVIKDLFSLGGEAQAFTTKVVAGQIGDDNIGGTGNSLSLFNSFDIDRTPKFLLGGEFIQRNIRGSLVNQKFGYQNYYRSIRAVPREENYFYYNLSKPLLNRFMKITYQLEAAYHTTNNRYKGDSVYKSDYRYNYYQFEGWLGFNINGSNFTAAEESERLRLLAGLRIVNKKFKKVPSIFKDQYNWQYADLSGILGSFTLYRQNFFKTQYIYGFGVNEDIPEGVLFSFTTGYTIKQDISRPFIGLNFQRNQLLKSNNYLEYILRFEGFLDKKRVEDITMLASVNYFDHLKRLGRRWGQRFFVDLSASRQINTVLDEPLLLNGKFAIPEYGYDFNGGDARMTSMIESVFYSPWSVIGFKMAPVASFNMTAFSPYQQNLKIFTAIGAGIRTRNESLVFGTIELKGNFFPRRNFYGNTFGIQLSTNLTFGNLGQIIQKPDFIEIN